MARYLIIISLFTALTSSTCKKVATNKEVTPPDVTAPVTYRPTFHFAPSKNWHNDPNGLVYYGGKYHLFYQYNPFGDTWGHMSWGHATSPDMMQWKEEPVAIHEYSEADGSITMAFSGTAVVDSQNTSGFGNDRQPQPLVAVYTSAANGKQHQSIAYSLDGINFTRFNQNPVLDVGSKDFRDPKIFWHSETRKWIMIVSKALEYKLEFYSSADLKSWTFVSDFGNKGNVSKIWECPDIFQLPVENEPGVTKWVVTVSAGHPQAGHLAMQYFVGDFDGDRFVADALDYPQYFDEGKDFYAGIIYNSLPVHDNRKIMIGWLNSWEYANVIPTIGFRGGMSIPRNLTLFRKGVGYILKQSPVSEFDNFLGDILFEKALMDVTGTSTTGVESDVLELRFRLNRGNYAKAGVRFLKNGEEETSIYLDSMSSSLCLDRTRSGNVNFSNRFSSVECVNMSNDEDVDVRILLDKSVVEVFINDGEKVITDRVFPYKAAGSVEFFSEGSTATFSNVTIKKVNASMKN
jgi:fructan beta-fructosidase